MKILPFSGFNLFISPFWCSCCSKSFIVLLSLYLAACSSFLKESDRDPQIVNAFINKMVLTHQFDQESLSLLLKSAEIKQDVIKKVSKLS